MSALRCDRCATEAVGAQVTRGAHCGACPQGVLRYGTEIELLRLALGSEHADVRTPAGQSLNGSDRG